MPFYEIIYETGNKSVAFYDDDKQAKQALSEHVRRAKAGEPGTGESNLRMDLNPGESRIGSWAAERVTKVLVYDDHPADYMSEQVVDSSEALEKIKAAIEATEMNGVVHIPTLAAAVRDMSSPLAEVQSAHASQYKAQEDRELDMKFLDEAVA